MLMSVVFPSRPPGRCPIGLGGGMPVFRTENLAPPRGLIAAVSRPHPLFSFSRKRKEGGEKKKPGQQTHGKRTHQIFLSYLLRIALAPKGAIVRIYAYLTGKRVLFPRYERADARSILGCVP